MISGAAIESLFDYMAMTKGFVVYAPKTDVGCDRIVDSGNLFKVQIKARSVEGNSVFFNVRKAKNTPYKKSDADIIALYIEQINSWYFIPFDECGSSFRINLNKDKFDKYKNNWDIFNETL